MRDHAIFFLPSRNFECNRARFPRSVLAVVRVDISSFDIVRPIRLLSICRRRLTLVTVRSYGHFHVQSDFLFGLADGLWPVDFGPRAGRAWVEPHERYQAEVVLDKRDCWPTRDSVTITARQPTNTACPPALPSWFCQLEAGMNLRARSWIMYPGALYTIDRCGAVF